jgi:hypothetical protein
MCGTLGGGVLGGWWWVICNAGDTLRLLVSATDNDGTTLATSAPTSTIPNAADPLGTPPANTTTTPTSPPAGSGTPNGTTPSESAQLHLETPASLRRAFASRAFQLTGQLQNTTGAPIADATLAISQQTSNNTTQLIAYTRTGPNGAFSVRIPAGPSRTIQVAYRAYSSDTSYAAQANIKETVNAGIQLDINPRHTGPESTITITGTAQGPIPPQGTIVELLVYYRGHWEPIRTPRTNTHGYFHVAYKFQGAIGHFPFRAEVPAGQTNFPYTTGHSNTINITTN